MEDKVMVEYEQHRLISVRAQQFYHAYVIQKKFLQ